LFKDVDNLGDWPSFIYCVKFDNNKNKNKKRYKHHQLSTGVPLVPTGNDDRKVFNEWENLYKGWKGKKEGTRSRSDAWTYQKEDT